MTNLNDLIKWATESNPEGTVPALVVPELFGGRPTPLSQLEIDWKDEFVRVLARHLPGGEVSVRLIMTVADFMTRLDVCRDPSLPPVPLVYISSSTGQGEDDDDDGDWIDSPEAIR